MTEEKALPEGMIPQEALDAVEEIQEKSTEQKELDEYEQSAQMFHILHSQFRRMSYALANRKKRAVARVLEAAMFEPLEKVELLGKEEQELFAITQQIMYHKNKIAEYVVKRKLEEEKQEESKKEEQGETNE